MAKNFTITTPIYYINGLPHIGNALTTIAADVTARYQKMQNKNIHFIVGTDENATKVYEYAKEIDKDPKLHTDEAAENFKDLWKQLGIQYTDFIRTTEDRHIKAVHHFFSILKKKGFVYQGKYEGWYDTSSETFYKESELIEGKSPDGNDVKWIEEENWFFKLSFFGEKLLTHIQNSPNFILPSSRANEVISFVKQGLRDVCITRINQGWGIPTPDDPGRVFYVWFEALINYIASCGWPNSASFNELWPCEVQWMGKDILTRFHATLWPAMLIGAGLPLPKTLIGHGWILMGKDKISKSKGNTTSPLELINYIQEKSTCNFELAVDVIRYYIIASLPYENDTTFTIEDFERRYNSDLANDFGNALNRSLVMIHKFASSKIPNSNLDPEVVDLVQSVLEKAVAHQENYRLDFYLQEGLGLIRFLNKYIDNKTPWNLAKANDPQLGVVLRSMVFLLRNAEGILKPIMPSACTALAMQLKLNPVENWSELGKESLAPQGHEVDQPIPIYPRIEAKRVENLVKENSNKKGVTEDFITIDEFKKVQLKIGEVIEAEEVSGSKKLLKLQVKIGDEVRQILSGIKDSYTSQEIVGRQVIVVTNLKPVKIMGIESQGMLLASEDLESHANLLTPEKKAPIGASVS